MANIDSLRTARMFDEKKLYTGADTIAALERLALSGEYEHAKPAKILVMGDYVAHEMSATMPRFAVRPENDVCSPHLWRAH